MSDGAKPPAPPLTLVYSTVDSLDLHCDVYVPRSTPPERPLPVLCWYHSGGLVNGGRNDMTLPTWLRDNALLQGWLFISVEYRFLVPSTGHKILQDVQAFGAFFASTKGLASHLAPLGMALDLTSIALSGASAGGYLARLHALNCKPKASCILSLYGMGGDFVGPHWVEAHTRGVRFNGPFSKWEDVAHLLDVPQKPIANAPIVTLADGDVNDVDFRSSLYNYWQCHGLYLDPLTGIDGFTAKMRSLPHTEREAAIPSYLQPLFVQLRVADLPPTVLIHGTEDTSVGI